MNDMTAAREISGNTVGFARVLQGAVSFKDSGIENVNSTYRGEILKSDGSTTFAYIKDLSSRELANEVMASLLGRALGLQIPDVYFALASDDVIKAELAPKLGEERILFASADATVPSISSFLNGKFSNTALRRIAEALFQNGCLASFYEFDTWSANVDRHPGNLLLSSDGGFWLIDHGYCFTGPLWVGHELNPDNPYLNRLREWVTPFLTQDELSDTVSRLGSLAQQISSVDLEQIGRSNKIIDLIGNEDFDMLVKFLKGRVPNIQRFAASALGRLT
ncbi:hypothetical protein FGI60_00590 [Brucella haematophila]|nr:hypothetical protein FGI60_00590 [Brucella haematophila]